MPTIFAYGKLNEPGTRDYLGVGFTLVAEEATLLGFKKHPYGDLSGDDRDWETIYAITPTGDPDDRVEGMLWEVDADGLRRIDAFESHPRLYQRAEVDVHLENDMVTCFAYRQNPNRVWRR